MDVYCSKMINLNNVEIYIQSINKNGGFKFSSASNVTLLSTGFAVSALDLLDSKYLLKINDSAANYLLGSKSVDDYFKDSNFDASANVGFHKNDYVIPQFTYFSMIALDHLGVHLDDLVFIHKFYDIKYLENWFENLHWDQFWYESNKIMFLLYFFSYLVKYGNKENREKSKEAIETSFKILNVKQAKNTGLWGTNLNNNNIPDGVYGAAHIYLFYEYFQKEIHYKEKIIDSVITMHSKNGLSQNEEGGACEDYDLVEIYSRVLKQTDYRKNEVFEQLSKMYSVIDNAQQKDGGFSYKLYRPKNISDRLFKRKPKDAVYTYSSWSQMITPIYYSDIWATFFRILTLESIGRMINRSKKLQSYTLPGWGYI